MLAPAAAAKRYPIWHVSPCAPGHPHETGLQVRVGSRARTARGLAQREEAHREMR